jgi:hypothetical protein
MKNKRSVKLGDIIVLVPQKYISEEVWIESINDDKVAEKVPAGSFAILVEKRKDSAVVMAETGFLGWVFNDEWAPVALQLA